MVYSLFDKVTMEGNNIASGVNADYSGVFSIGNRLYISYIKDNITHIKYKESNNSLLSLSITSPNKTTYTVGDNVDLTGLKVIANYTKNRKELSNNEYTITNFNTNKVGSYSATITYEGISNTFNYEVIEKVILNPLKSINLNKTSGTKYIGETENLIVSYNPSNTTDNKSITWTTSNSKVATINNGVVKAVGVGNAVITAKVMNKTATYNITVKKKENRPITYKYTYDSSKKIIYKLNNNININTFKNNLNYNPIIKSNNNILKDNDLIRTNMTITYTDDEGNVQIYNTSVLGDVNGDGNINALDYVKIKNHIMNTKKILKDVFILSADYNNDGKISALDYVRIKNYIMNGGK